MSVSAIIVTYEPDLEELGRLIAAVSPQVDHLIVVDNGSQADLTCWLAKYAPTVRLIALGDNYGIARAQNTGINEARATGASHVLLLDQDSIPASDMVAKLVDAAEAKRAAGIRVAAVGPRYEDARQMNPIPFTHIDGLRVRRCTCPCPASVVAVDYLIASGCLIPMEALDVVGEMREDFFIDYVDIEWGLRAQWKGFNSFGACAARMNHTLGNNPVHFRKRYIPVHSPLRHYYHFRNAVWLYRQPWLRKNWKIVDGIRLMRKFVFYSLMTSPRLKHAGMMILGMVHGLTGRLGKKRWR